MLLVFFKTFIYIATKFYFMFECKCGTSFEWKFNFNNRFSCWDFPTMEENKNGRSTGVVKNLVLKFIINSICFYIMLLMFIVKAFCQYTKFYISIYFKNVF